MNRICKWWGHSLNYEAAHYYAIYECTRCGQVYYDETGLREWLRIRVWLARQWIGRETRHWREWLRCSDCRHWFGRHDDDVDHLPF